MSICSRWITCLHLGHCDFVYDEEMGVDRYAFKKLLRVILIMIIITSCILWFIISPFTWWPLYICCYLLIIMSHIDAYNVYFMKEYIHYQNKKIKNKWIIFIFSTKFQVKDTVYIHLTVNTNDDAISHNRTIQRYQ